MWKPLVVLAIVANTVLITPSEANRKCKKPNEIFDLCPNPCPPRECGVNKALILCAPAPKPGSKDCKPGCRCADGFLKNRAGICILEDECQYDCAKNETLDPCYSDCPPRYCGINIAAVTCLKINESDCERGCRCSDGYQRNAEGNCVLEEDCPQCPYPNEVFDVCPAPCPPRQCDVDETLIDCKPGPRPGDPECEPGCRCADGFFRNPYGICVSRDRCPQCPGPYEEYDICPNPCPPQRCDVDPSVIRCKAPPKPGDPECQPGCRCVEGYVKNEDGICVTRDQCPQNKCTGEHEQYSKCPALVCRAKNCTQVGFPQPCPLPGLDTTPTCGKDEVYSACTNSDCGPQKCSQLGFAIPCPRIDPAYCIKGCVCKTGFVRAANGTCIPKNKCPSCGGDPNAISGCGNNCGRRCSNYNSTKPVICTALCILNGCNCKEGFVLDDSTGKCIRPKQCVSCAGDFNAKPGCDQNCTKRCPGPKPAECKCYKDGCTCKEKFVYDPKTNKCVRLEQCTPHCGNNEVLSNCSNGGCGPWRCTDVGFRTGCVKMDQKYCTVGCVCEEGYVRDENEVCIPATDCPTCGGDPNATVGCGINCGRHCSERNKTEPVFCTAECIENSCDCRKGFWLDDNTGQCVSAEDCTQTCGKDEVYSACTNSDCGPQKCSQLGFAIPCPRIDPAYCIKGCVCRTGLVRAANGTCIPKNKCPSCGGDPNAISGCGNNCGRRCSNYNSTRPVLCTALCRLNGCDCKEGFVLDDSTGKCIRPKQCVSCAGDFNAKPGCDQNCTKRCPGPKPAECKCIKDSCTCKDKFVYDPKTNKCVRLEQCTPPCGNNEVLSNCSNGGCGPWRCTDVGFRTGCVKMDQKYCTIGCVCEKGYVRDENEVCIPVTDCPTCGGDPNATVGCGINCGRHCSERNKTEPVFCTAECIENGCDCRKGFWLDDKTGKCVLAEDCTNCPGANEIYDPCPPSCPPQTCESIGQKYFCPLMSANKTSKDCHGACRCKPNFLRNKIGECILAKDCPPVCKEHEVYSECTNGGCQARNCTQLGQPVPCKKLDPKYCIKGCVCEDGYLRARNGTCVLEAKCDNCNKPHEHYDPCAPTCPPQTCESIGRQYKCPATAAVCKGACRCDEGYFRNKKGDCILKKNCLKCTGLHEYWSCGSACDNECATLYKQNQTNCPIRNIKCNEKCYCEEGYARDKCNACIPIDKCPPPTCGKNEVFNSCANGGCGKWNCSQLGQPDLCIDVIECIGGCICQKGFLRTEKGTCVPIDQCPIPSCGENERFEFYPGSICEPQSCTELGMPLTCSAENTSPGDPSCICVHGFVRNEYGDCIPKKQCPMCGGDPNAEAGCGYHCGGRCCNYNKGPIPCPKRCKLNACDCKIGFIFDSNTRKCVRPKACTPVCRKHEVYSECINGGCQRKNCSQLGKAVPCVKMDPKYCIKGCLCKEGYLREANGVCVPEKKCGRKCWGHHEVYNTCPSSCPPQTCESINKTYHCPLMKIDEKDCKPACRCKEGYWRNQIGQCISTANCLKCTGPHEYWSCRSACDNVCENLHEQDQDNCPIKKSKCTEMCYCEKGYARNKNKVCVPIEKCPPPKCGANERLEECPDWLCTPQSCSQLGYPIACPALQGTISSNATCPGRPGCVCIDNYVRHDCGECIPVDECESCRGDPNAVSGCGIHCGRLCSNYKQKNVICPLICKINDCDCRKGYVFDTNTGKCVLPKDCTPTCGKNEVYDTCANGGCENRNCSQLGGLILCIDPIKCIGGCVCQKGYLRNQNGTCVPENQCPQVCTKPHEVYDPCPRTCPPQTCATIGIAYPCPHPPEGEEFCRPVCRCEVGYYRNSADECISEEDCSKCTGPNEHFSCGPPCDNECATLATHNRTNCPYINKRCNSKCYCNDGHARNDDGICIPIDQCGVSCRGDPNAIPGCGGYCGNRCSNYNKGVVACTLSCMLNGCDCKQSYVFDDNLGICVQPEDCTKVCGKDEVYNTCINGGCQKKKCTDLARPNICIHPKNCIDGCLCKEGMLRTDNGTCVPIDDCPTPVCPKNEVFDRCANGGCNRRKCSELTGPKICKDPLECIGDCVCVKGFLRNEDGVCVKERKCNPQCNKPHQVFNPCPSTCPPQTCESLEKAYICPIEYGQEPPCQPGCVCEEGYYFNLIGECVSEENCLQCNGPHEYFSCGQECDNVCATLSEQNKTNCPIINIQCNEQCYCEDGYARNEKNICIPIEQCPVKCQGEHKVFDPCPKTPRTCKSLDDDYSCDSESSEEETSCCKPGCVCEEGYYENAIGQCLTKEECLKCRGPHEYYTCGGACDNVCNTLNEQSQADCPIVNIRCNEMCYCEEGYARNATKICIPIEDCPPSRCGPDERYEESPCRVCEPLTCDEVGMELECPPVEDDDCDDTPGCICKFGLVRNEDGVCIPISECRE